MYDTVEPTVIDEDLLKQCIEEQGPPDEAGKIAKKEGIDFSEVKQLRLDFKSEWFQKNQEGYMAQKWSHMYSNLAIMQST